MPEILCGKMVGPSCMAAFFKILTREISSGITLMESSFDSPQVFSQDQ